ncbi:MAG: segregation/condensation protein A [Bacilli bacterium]|nr:segregation/condensation protein A [Bacilli bacterium]
MNNITINDFEGPLDLLLHLVKTSKMDIYEINTSYIIEEYLKYISEMQDLNIDVASEYLVMAAELIHLKSKMLINIDDEEEQDEDEYSISSEEELKQRLIDYEKYKRSTDSFRELEENRKEYLTRSPENIMEYAKEIKYNGDLSIEDLLNAFLEYRKRLDKEKPLETKITRKELSVKERIKSIRNILKTKKKIVFTELFESFRKDYVVVTFLSILSMSNNNEIILTQKDNFSPIMIESRL